MFRLLAPSLTSCSRTQVHRERGAGSHGAAGGARGCSAPSHQARPSPGVGDCCHTAPLPQDTGHVGASEAMEDVQMGVPQPPPAAAGPGTKPVHPTSRGHTAAARRAQLLFQSPLLSSGIWEKGHRLPSASPRSRTGPGSDQKPCGPDSEPGQGCPPAGVWRPWRRGGGDGRGSLTPDMPLMVPRAAPLSPALHPAGHVVPPRPPSPDPDRIVTAAWGGGEWQLLGPSARPARNQTAGRAVGGKGSCPKPYFLQGQWPDSPWHLRGPRASPRQAQGCLSPPAQLRAWLHPAETCAQGRPWGSCFAL